MPRLSRTSPRPPGRTPIGAVMDDRASSEQRAGTGEPVPASDAEPEVVDAEVVDEGEQAASEVE